MFGLPISQCARRLPHHHLDDGGVRPHRTGGGLLLLAAVLVLVGVLRFARRCHGLGRAVHLVGHGLCHEGGACTRHLLFTLKKIGDDAEADLPPKLNPMKSVALVARGRCSSALVAVSGIDLPTAAARSSPRWPCRSHFIGLTAIVIQRSIFKQIFGYV